jgi:hypothetical protein
MAEAPMSPRLLAEISKNENGLELNPTSQVLVNAIYQYNQLRRHDRIPRFGSIEAVRQFHESNLREIRRREDEQRRAREIEEERRRHQEAARERRREQREEARQRFRRVQGGVPRPAGVGPLQSGSLNFLSIPSVLLLLPMVLL